MECPDVQTKPFSCRRRNRWGSRVRTVSPRTAWSTQPPARRGGWWRGSATAAEAAAEPGTVDWVATAIPMVAPSTTRDSDTQTCCLVTRRCSSGIFANQGNSWHQVKLLPLFMANRQNYMTEPTSEITSINWRVVKPLSASIIWIFTGRTDPLNVRVKN